MLRAPRLILALLLSLSLLALTAAVAVALVPKGQGLATLAAQGITNLECDDPSIRTDDIVVPRGGGVATWVADGRMYLVLSIDIVGTVTTPDGSFPIAFSKTYGQRSGLSGDLITCTFDQTFEEDGATGEATGTVVLVRVW